jgi:hypothetical protein
MKPAAEPATGYPVGASPAGASPMGGRQLGEASAWSSGLFDCFDDCAAYVSSPSDPPHVHDTPWQ